MFSIETRKSPAYELGHQTLQELELFKNGNFSLSNN